MSTKHTPLHLIKLVIGNFWGNKFFCTPALCHRRLLTVYVFVLVHYSGVCQLILASLLTVCHSLCVRYDFFAQFFWARFTTLNLSGTYLVIAGAYAGFFLFWREFDGDFHFSVLIMADIADPIYRTGKSAATSRWSSAVRSQTSSSTNLEALLPRKPGTDEGERAKRISLDPSQCLELVKEPSFSNYSSELLLCSNTNIYISIFWIFRVCCFFSINSWQDFQIYHHMVRLIDWLLDFLIDWFIVCFLWLIDWLIDWFTRKRAK